MDVRVSSPIFIGRADELARLRHGIAEAREGRSAKFLIRGEAGVGKTRLVTEFASEARQQGALVLSGGCIDLGEGGVPYAPIVEALRTWVHSASNDEVEATVGHSRGELARLVPDLGPIDEPSGQATGVGTGLNIGSAQGRLFELLLALLQRLATRSPVALEVEDIHWSDRSTRDLLAFLIRNVRDMAVLIVLTYRSDELHRRHPLLPFLAEIERSGRVERIDLGRFDRRELGAQLRAIAGAGIEQALIDSIDTRSEGNPFFAEELLMSARERGTAELEPTLREALLVRVSGLSDAAQRLLRVASAAGRRVDPTLMAAVTGMDEGALYEALREAVAHHILIPDEVAGEERYAFRHALLQEAVYDDLLPGERTRLHAGFAQTLEDLRVRGGASRPGELAYHWYAAHDLPRAFDAALLAAAAAEAAYAFPEALAHYERALELWDLVPEAASRAGMDRVDLLSAAASVGRFAEAARAASHIRTALALVDEEADPIRAGLLHERLGRYSWFSGQGELALEAHRTAVRLIPAQPPSEARARVLAGLAQVLMLQRHFPESRRHADAAIELARLTGARQIEGHALNTRGCVRVEKGEVAAALADIAEALRIAEEVGNLDDIGRAYANHAGVLESAGRLEEAVQVSRAGLTVAKRLGLLALFGTHYLWNTANLLYQLGRWDESQATIRQAEETLVPGINELLVREVVARLALSRGQLEAADAELTALRSMAATASDAQLTLPVHASLAELALWQRRPSDAAEAVVGGLASIGHSPDIRHSELRVLGLRAQADMAEAARARRSPDELAAAISSGRAFHAEMRQRHAAIASHSATLEPQSAAWMGLADAELGRLEGSSDPDAWLTSGETWDALSRPYLAAYSHWREAEALLAARGDRRRAASALARVMKVTTALGAMPLQREVEALAHRARLPLGETEPVAPDSAAEEAAQFGLTAREREVLGLVAAGRTNRQIGDELFISEKTAGVHVSNILGKLGVSGRGEAAALAHQLGLTQVTQILR